MIKRDAKPPSDTIIKCHGNGRVRYIAHGAWILDSPEVALAPVGAKAEIAFTSSLMSFLNREMLIVVKPEREREMERLEEL